MHTRLRASVVCWLLVLSSAATTAAQELDVTGAWRAESYRLGSGPTHRVEGHIFFTRSDWTVLFFVTRDDGIPARGSAEGGTYTLSGDRLVFTHLYHLSQGEAMEGLEASPLRMERHQAAEAPREPCRVERTGDRLVLYFPSGNSMTFTRSSGS